MLFVLMRATDLCNVGMAVKVGTIAAYNSKTVRWDLTCAMAQIYGGHL